MDNGPAPSAFKRWFDQAWNDWIQPLGLIGVIGLGYAGYKFGILGERVTGVSIVLVTLLSLVAFGLATSWKLARTSAQRTSLLVMAVLALGGAVWPTIRIAWNPAPLATGELTAASPKVELETGVEGPYEILVSAHFKQAGASDVEASYSLDVQGQGGATKVSGELKRSTVRNRTSRRGGTSVSTLEHTENVHRVPDVLGSKITIATDGIDDQIDGGLTVALRSGGPRPEIFWVLSGLSLLLALILDSRLGNDLREEDRKFRGPKREISYLTPAMGMLAVFAVSFTHDAMPSALVRSALSALVLALIAGGVCGWLLAAFARLATRPRRKA